MPLLLVLAGLACLLAAILQFAVYRSPDVRDAPFTRVGRRLSMVTMLMAGVMILNTVFGDAPYLPPLVCLLFALLALSQIMFALRDLFPQLEKEHPTWTSHLTSSR